MAKIKLTTDERRNIFLHTTKVENLFINEFLPDAPGDYVKVFIFGLMYAQYDQALDSAKISMTLGLSEEEIEEAWIYWDSRGLVKLSTEFSDDGEPCRRLSFVSQIESLYGKSSAESAEGAGESDSYRESPAADKDSIDEEIPHFVNMDDIEFDAMFEHKMQDNRLRAIYTKYQEVSGRTVSRRETGKIDDAIKVYGINPDIFSFAIDYCADLEKYSIDYIFKVALRWTEDGCKSIEEVKKLLEKHSLRNSWYTQVFKALGFRRLPAPADREIMDKWFDEMGCGIGEVLEACKATAGIREPNLRYVNKVLENSRLEKGGINTMPKQDGHAAAKATPVSRGGSPVSRKVLNDYYQHLREEGERERRFRVAEVTHEVPGMEVALESESRINSSLLMLRPGDVSRGERERLKAERARLEETKKELLITAGFPADYLDRKYKCDICRDTGYTDAGMVCRCAKDRAKEAFNWIGDNNKSE